MASFFPPWRSGRRRSAGLAVSVALATGLVAGVLPTITASAAAAAQRQDVQWSSCGEEGTRLECAELSAPRDWAHPTSGPDLSLTITRIKATDAAHRKGILFTNPGGPGGGGVTLPVLIAQAQPKIAAQYDIIGMDPRGVGNSTPLICDVPTDQLTGPEYDARDLSAAAITSRQKALKAIADGCATNPLTPYINTWQTTHDMDLIRSLLGERKLNYLGYSYGTWLGAKYAALFPQRTGKIILDSNTSWMGDLAESWELMPKAFQRRWEQQLVHWTNRSKVFAKYVGTTPAAVNALYERERSAFIKYTGRPSAGVLLDNTVRSALYTDAGFVQIAFTLGVLNRCLLDNQDWSSDAFTACVSDFTDRVNKELGGSAAELRTQVSDATAILLHPEKLGGEVGKDGLQPILQAASNATGDTTKVSGAFFAVRCGDGGQWHSPRWWVDFARRNGPVYPLATYSISAEVCSYWSLPAHELPKPAERRLGPIVTVQAEFDPATGYESTPRNVRRFSGARLIAVDDAGSHGQYGIRGNACVDDTVNAYLLDDQTPPRRTVCTGTPLPLENVVYPEPGPVDSRAHHPRTVKVRHVPDKVRHEADKIIK